MRRLLEDRLYRAARDRDAALARAERAEVAQDMGTDRENTHKSFDRLRDALRYLASV